MKTIEVQDVGPIQHLEIPLPEDGGIVVLRGRNGSGKSRALEAAEALVTGKGVADVDARDGTPGGLVEGLGARITVKKRSRRSGELEVVHLDSALDPSVLVDPGIKDEDAADARRIKALIGLAGVKVGAKEFEKVSPDFADVIKPSSITEDPVETAGRIKRDFESAARLAESHRDEAAARASAMAEQIEGIDLTTPADHQLLADAVERAVRELAEAEGRALAEAARAELAARALERYEKAEAEYDGLTVEEAADVLARQHKATQKAVVALEKAKKLVIACRLEESHAEELFASARQYSALADAAHQAVAATARGGDAVTAEEIERLRRSLDNARIAEERGRQVRAALSIQQKVAGEKERARHQAALAERLRAAAAATEDVLTDALASFELALGVYQGRLVTQTKRGQTLFAQLSQGERWRIALPIAIKTVGKGGLLIVSQDAWEGLDPINRAQINEQVKAATVTILTAEAADGELTAQTYAKPA